MLGAAAPQCIRRKWGSLYLDSKSFGIPTTIPPSGNCTGSRKSRATNDMTAFSLMGTAGAVLKRQSLLRVVLRKSPLQRAQFWHSSTSGSSGRPIPNKHRRRRSTPDEPNVFLTIPPSGLVLNKTAKSLHRRLAVSSRTPFEAPRPGKKIPVRTVRLGQGHGRAVVICIEMGTVASKPAHVGNDTHMERLCRKYVREQCVCDDDVDGILNLSYSRTFQREGSLLQGRRRTERGHATRYFWAVSQKR